MSVKFPLTKSCFYWFILKNQVQAVMGKSNYFEKISSSTQSISSIVRRYETWHLTALAFPARGAGTRAKDRLQPSPQR